MNHRYIIIGPGLKNEELSIGGTTVSFELLCAYFKKQGGKVQVIYSNVYRRGPADVVNSLIVFIQLIRGLPFADVVFLHASPRGILVLSPFAAMLCGLFRKKLVLRVFGGDLDEVIENSKFWVRFIWNHLALHAELLCLQTKMLVKYFKLQNKKVYWLPTSRIFPVIHDLKKQYRKRFVFISQIFPDKGIDYILKLKNDLPNEFTLDIYGPVLDSKYSFLLNEKFYFGSLSPEKVTETLQQYDVLILPTMHKGEGYPGIIIESLGAGVPVIAFDWKCIGEVIHNRENGILVQAGDYSELLHQIVNLNADQFSILRNQAIKSSVQYNSDEVNANLVIKLESL